MRFALGVPSVHTRKLARRVLGYLLLTLFPVLGVAAAQSVAIPVKAEKIGDEAFFMTECVQVAIRKNGAFGHTRSRGSLVTDGFFPTSSGMGFVAKRDCSLGWVDGNFNGDYFMPGTPYEGWALEVDGEVLTLNNSSGTSLGTLGAIDDQTATEYRVSWTYSWNGLSIAKTYRIPKAGASIYVDVTLTNVSDTELQDVYYGRGVDPDDDSNSPNVYPSTNTVVSQYGPSTPYSLVTARFSNVSLLGLFSADPRARVAREFSGFNGNFVPSTVWSGSSPFLGAVGSTALGDNGMNLAVEIGDLSPGASTSFTFAYLLSESAVDDNVSAAAGQVTNITDTSASFTATSSVSATGYWIVVDRDSAAPTAAQIVSGTNYASVQIRASGSSAMAAGQDTAFTISELVEGTAYDVYFVADDSGTLSDVTKLQFASKILVTAVVSGTNGDVSPTSVYVESGGAATFTVSPANGYEAGLASPCGGSLAGTAFTTGSVTERCEVVVEFLPRTYSLSFDANGGTVSPVDKLVTFDAPVGVLPVPTRDEYLFVAWNTASDGTGTTWDEATTFTETSSVTLFAQWQAAPRAVLNISITGRTQTEDAFTVLTDVLPGSVLEIKVAFSNSGASPAIGATINAAIPGGLRLLDAPEATDVAVVCPHVAGTPPEAISSPMRLVDTSGNLSLSLPLEEVCGSSAIPVGGEGWITFEVEAW